MGDPRACRGPFFYMSRQPARWDSFSEPTGYAGTNISCVYDSYDIPYFNADKFYYSLKAQLKKCMFANPKSPPRITHDNPHQSSKGKVTPLAPPVPNRVLNTTKEDKRKAPLSLEIMRKNCQRGSQGSCLQTRLGHWHVGRDEHLSTRESLPRAQRHARRSMA